MIGLFHSFLVAKILFFFNIIIEFRKFSIFQMKKSEESTDSSLLIIDN